MSTNYLKGCFSGAQAKFWTVFAHTHQKENKDFTHETLAGLIRFDVREAGMK